MPCQLPLSAKVPFGAENVDGDTIIEIEGTLDSSLADELRQEAISLIRPGCRLVLDLSGLDEVSPTGVRMLLLFFRARALRRRDHLRHGASPQILDIAEAAGYLDLFRKAAPAAATPICAVVGRIDAYPTHTIAGFAVRPGIPTVFGATPVAGGVNFAVYSQHATACTLVLFETGGAKPLAEIRFPPEFRVGNVFAMTVFDLDIDHLEYGYRLEGPFDPESGHRFDATKVLLDPMARTVCGREVWGVGPEPSEPYPYRRESRPRTSIGKATHRCTCPSRIS